jgi:hypothetical protein
MAVNLSAGLASADSLGQHLTVNILISLKLNIHKILVSSDEISFTFFARKVLSSIYLYPKNLVVEIYAIYFWNKRC